MRGFSFAPTGGISGRLYAHWLKLSNMNIINGMIEKGFIQTQTGRHIALHPMIQEITVNETTPSVENVFPYMEKYHYTAGMELLISKLHY